MWHMEATKCNRQIYGKMIIFDFDMHGIEIILAIFRQMEKWRKYDDSEL